MCHPNRAGALLTLFFALVGAPLAAAEDGGAEPTWVFFSDRCVAPEHLEAALAERRAALSPRALVRRQRVRGDAGLDERDLDPCPAQVDAVLAVGVPLRATSRWLNAISVVADAEQRERIRALGSVDGLQPVARRSREAPLVGRGAPALPPPPNEEYGVALEQMGMIGIPSLAECGLTGDGVVLGIQDTGFSRAHQSLTQVDVLDEWDFVNGDDSVADQEEDLPGTHDHGTSVLSIIAGWDEWSYIGAAPDVSVILAKTEDVSQEEPIEEDWFVEGLEWIEAQGADLSTASLGYFDWYEPEDMDGQTAVTTIAATIAVGNGLILINSAGNGGPEPSTLGAPADADGLMAIGAVDFFGHVADFSSRGPTADGRIKPDVSAPGVQTWVVDPATPDQYRQGNGTSYAAPHVAGLAALLLQAFGPLDPDQMASLLTSSATQADSPDNDMGWGLVDGVAAVGLFCTCQDQDEDGYYDASCGGADCDDFRDTVFPGAEEICDGFDDNCDGELLEGEGDTDGDGYLACEGDPALHDCDDADADTHPGASEVPYDGVDQDCDDEDVVDVDGDGVDGPVEDCDDEDPQVFPGAAEDCGDNVDNDCDGWIDGGDAECHGDNDAFLADPGGCQCNVAARGPDRAAFLLSGGLLIAAFRRRFRI
jgi:subtilisin family serine protease